jgi:hypothetical protein
MMFVVLPTYYFIDLFPCQQTHTINAACIAHYAAGMSLWHGIKGLVDIFCCRIHVITIEPFVVDEMHYGTDDYVHSMVQSYYHVLFERIT